jgi:hypothetical protein
MVSKRIGNALIIVGLVTLVIGFGMSSTSTITGSTQVPESCVDTGFGNECFGGGEIRSETTVENPSKGPTIVGGLFLTGIGFVVRVGASSQRSFREGRQQAERERQIGNGGDQIVDTDGGSATDTHRQQAQTKKEVSSNSQQSDLTDLIQKYDNEIKYYGSIIVGIIVIDFLVSFLFGPTFIMDGFLGRIVTLLSWVVGGIAGSRFHERRLQ